MKIFFIEFHKNISAKIFFTIFSRVSFVFDVCEIMRFANFYLKFCLLRIFLFCKFGVRKKIVNFFSAMNVNTKFENVSFLKKSKISLIVLLDFFTHY